MKITYIPYSTILICATTLLYSMYVAFDVTGNLFGNIKIIQLEPYGGITFAHLGNLELWRLFASQLIHAKQIHMLYSVFTLLALGVFVERHLNYFQFFCLYFASGAVGTLVSTLTVDPPWNLGTGASQAIFGVAAFGMLLAAKKIEMSWEFYGVLAFSIVPALTLDLIYAGHPKLGHVTGFVMGGLIGLLYLWFEHRQRSRGNS
jgi:rhomboid protease GluP